MAFFLGFLLGIWGYLNVGIINLGIIELSNNQQIPSRIKSLLQIIVCAVIFEVLYCFVVVFFIEKILTIKFLHEFLQIFTILLLCIFCVIAFQSAQKSHIEKKVLPKTFILGIYLAIIIHPQQISFWGVWGLYFIQNGYLIGDIFSVLMFAIGAGVGAGSFFIFLFLMGIYFFDWVKKHKSLLHYITFMVMLTLVLFMCKKYFID